MSDSILDGTGRGYLAQVDDENRLVVYATTLPLLESKSQQGEAFNLNTGLVPITVATETPLLYFLNAGISDVTIAAFFIGVGTSTLVGPVTDNIIMRVYADPTSVSGGVSISAQNRRIGSSTSFAFDTRRQDAGTPLLATMPSDPVLLQYQTVQNRTFGEVYLTLPRARSLVVTVQANGSQNFNIYAGFSGYTIG